MLVNRTYRTYVKDYPNVSGYANKQTNIPDVALAFPPLYSGGAYVLAGSEFTVSGSTVNYNYTKNTATLSDFQNATSISCYSQDLDGNINISKYTALIYLSIPH